MKIFIDKQFLGLGGQLKKVLYKNEDIIKGNLGTRFENVLYGIRSRKRRVNHDRFFNIIIVKELVKICGNNLAAVAV